MFQNLDRLLMQSWFGIEGPSVRVNSFEQAIESINSFMAYIPGITTVVTVIMLVYGGFQYATAGADDNKISNAQGIIKSSLIAFAIVMSAALILRGVMMLFENISGIPI